MTENSAVDTVDTIDIVALVQNNPLTRLSHDYGSKIVQKIRERFTQEEQQIYVANLYCYYNYDQKKDFVILLDSFWKWMGYGRIEECKRCLVKNFKENVDYKIEKAAPQNGGAGPKVSEEGKNLGGAGLNKERITLTVNCFKKLCLKSRTEQADKIHDYYVELENVMNELVAEQAEELRMKLENNQKQLKIKNMENRTIIIKNFKNKQVIYLIQVEDKIIKFGYTKDIEQRFKDHLAEFGPNITIVFIYETIYNREFESMIKVDEIIKPFIFEKVYKKNQTELIKLDKNFTFNDLTKRIEYLKDNVNADLIPKLIEEIKLLKQTQVKIDSDSEIVLKLTKENNILKREIDELSDLINMQNDKESGNCIYIMHNQTAKDLHKIGIIEYSDDLVKDRSYVHIVKTDNARPIKNILKIMLKPCLNTDNLTYTISYDDIKKIFDFCVAMYDTFLIHKNTINVVDFVSRYNTFKLKIKSRERHSISPEIYKLFMDNTLIYNKNYKIPMVVLCEEFYNWYIENYDPDKSKSTIKINNDWSTVFRSEFMHNLETVTGVKQSNINIVTENLYYHGYTGFIGFSTQNFEEKLREDKRFYKTEIYQEYINKFIKVTRNERHKVSRKELLSDFKNYVTLNNIYNKSIFNKTFSFKFINEFMKEIEIATGLTYESDRTKKADKGCFVGIEHSNFDCIVNTSMKEVIKDDKKYKKESKKLKKHSAQIINTDSNTDS